MSFLIEKRNEEGKFMEVASALLQDYGALDRSNSVNHQTPKNFLEGNKEEKAVSSEQNPPTLISRVVSAANRCFESPCFLGSLVFINMGILVTACIQISPVLTDYATTCFDAFNSFSNDLLHCRTPFLWKMNMYKSMIGVSCGLTGYILQKTVETRPGEEEELLEQDGEEQLNSVKPHASENGNVQCSQTSLFSKFRQLVNYAEDCLSYELNIGLGWLYSGLWINTSSIPTWNFYLNCQSGAIGVACFFLGMFSRTQWLVVKPILFNKETAQEASDGSHMRLENYWQEISLSIIGAILMTVVSANRKQFSSLTYTIAREVSVMVMARLIGQVATDWAKQKKAELPPSFRRKVVSLFYTYLSLQTIQIILGYSAYLSSSQEIYRFLGMGIIGIAQGAKNSCYEPLKQKERPEAIELPEEGGKCRKAASKVYSFIRANLGILALSGFAIAAAKSNLFACYETISEDLVVCPLCLELSSNYISISDNGFNIAVISGVVDYYIRRFFRLTKEVNNHIVQKISNTYINMRDKYQFDLIILLPYAVFQTGHYIAAYETYTSFDPIPVLILLGSTFGTYKENIHHGVEKDPFKPIFTNTAAALPTF